MTMPLERMQALLPLPYANDPRALVGRLLDVYAHQLDAVAEDLDRLRKSHWLELAYRGQDVDKLAALFDIARFEGEPTPIFRQHFIAVLAARLRGAVTPGAIRQFVFDYLRAMERLLECTLVPGLDRVGDADAWKDVPARPNFRPLRLIENPPRVMRSLALRTRAGQVTQLFRWTETNAGVEPAPVTYRFSGIPGGGTAVPAILNVTSRQLIGYRGRVPFGKSLTIEAKPDGEQWIAAATLDDRDVTERLYAYAPFSIGDAPQPVALVAPMLQRGENELLFLALARYDEPGFDRASFMLEDPLLREAVFDETRFDHSLFPTEPLAMLEMSWVEQEAAAFEIRIPRGVVVESSTVKDELALTALNKPPHAAVAAEIEQLVPRLRAAGVRSELRLEPFRETQRQLVRFSPTWLVLPPGEAPAGENDRMQIGARFDESTLAMSLFN